MDWTSLVGAAAVAVVAWLGRRFSTPLTNSHRAAVLSRLAGEAAALIVGMQGRATYPELLKAAVNMVSAIPGVPTRSLPAIERACAGALTALGKNPNAPIR